MITNMIYFLLLVYPASLVGMAGMMFFFMDNEVYHPINQMMVLMFLVITLSVFMTYTKENSLYPLLMMITFISGILVMFSYFAALSNKPLEVPSYFGKTFITVALATTLSAGCMMYHNYFPMFSFATVNFKVITIHEVFGPTTIWIYGLLMLTLSALVYFSTKVALTKFWPLRCSGDET